MDIVCVSVMGWSHPFPTSRHHLARALGRRHRVLFVDNAMNPATAYARAKDGFAPATEALDAWTGRRANPHRVAPGVFQLVPPPVAPMGRLGDRLFAPVYAYNQRRLGAAVHAACRFLDFQRPRLWLSFNVLGSEGPLDALPGAPALYHCTDAIEALPGASAHAPAIERRLVARCDVMVASSRALYAAHAPRARRAVYLPHGAEVARFAEALDPDLAPHPAIADWARAGRPVIGFLGHLEERVDFSLLAELADARPGWNFALAGPVAPSRQAVASALAQRPNVRLLGLVPAHQAPAFLRGVDVATIPFVSSPQTRAIYPLKLNEYLAAGKAVAVTPFADLDDFAGGIEVGGGVDGFADAIARALADDAPDRRAARLALAAANSWEGRAATLEGLLAAL